MWLIDYFCSAKSRDDSKNKSRWSFQEDAVADVIFDLKTDSIAKKLIVIPTGGGKTIVGLQVINKLINVGFFDKNKKALWTVHSTYLKTQTKEYLTHPKHKGLREKIKLNVDICDYLDVEMIGESSKILSDERRLNYKLLIIDEAHHASASSYKSFFSYNIGIIGLTATPTRLDRKELPFTGIAYSVKFSALEKLGVITMPTMQNIATELNIDSTDITSKRQGAKFDTPERNRFIADWIFKNRAAYKFKKIVIFAGSKNHAKNLYDEIRKNNDYYNNPFEHIGYIFGGDINDQNNQSNDDYLEDEKKRTSSIVINCQVLNEGYDDPLLDTVIMATPSNSTVYYMQCMGRVVRVPEDNKSIKKAYLFEFVDRLPNIAYRVDSRWLYGEIEQELLPILPDDISYSSEVDRRATLESIFKQHKIQNKYIDVVSTSMDENFGLLIFTDHPDPSIAEWFPLLIDNSENGKKYLNGFNKLSLIIDRHAHYGYGNSADDDSEDYIIFDLLAIDKSDELFKEKRFRSSFIYSLARAYSLKENRKKVDCLKYYTFKKIRRLSMLCKILLFIKNLLTS